MKAYMQYKNIKDKRLAKRAGFVIGKIRSFRACSEENVAAEH